MCIPAFYIARQMTCDDHILLIQFDQTSVNVSAFYEHKPAFMRHFPLEPYEEMEIDKASPFIDPFEDIYKEIERMMKFYSFSLQQGKQQITRVFLIGDHAQLPHVYEALQERFEAPVEQLSASMAGAVDARYYLAWGLALKEGTDDDR
jgi:type IV pilus assembly protein PilM